jgi:hypothetical protein
VQVAMGLLIFLGSCQGIPCACLNLPIRPVCSERDIPDVVRLRTLASSDRGDPLAIALTVAALTRRLSQVGYMMLLKLSPDDLAAASCNGQTVSSGSCSLLLDQYLPSPRPSGGSLVIIGPGIGLPGPIAFLGGWPGLPRPLGR